MAKYYALNGKYFNRKKVARLERPVATKLILIDGDKGKRLRLISKIYVYPLLVRLVLENYIKSNSLKSDKSEKENCVFIELCPHEDRRFWNYDP